MSTKPTRPRIPGPTPDPLSTARLYHLCVLAGTSLDTAARHYGCEWHELTQPEVARLGTELEGQGLSTMEMPPEAWDAAFAAWRAGHPDCRAFLASWYTRAAGHLTQGLSRDEAAAAATEVVIAAARDYVTAQLAACARAAA